MTKRHNRVYADRSDAQNREICRLWEAGNSSTAIVKIMAKKGLTLTRNSVIGQAHRDGAMRPASAQTRIYQKPVPKPRAKMELPSIKLADIPVLRIPLFKAKDGECRYPLWDGPSVDFPVCGAESVGPYCIGHKAIAWVPPRPRAGDKP